VSTQPGQVYPELVEGRGVVPTRKPNVARDLDRVALSLAKRDRHALQRAPVVDLVRWGVIRSGSLSRLRDFGERKNAYEWSRFDVRPHADAPCAHRFAFEFLILGGCITLT
jgi:hypothetical protein